MANLSISSTASSTQNTTAYDTSVSSSTMSSGSDIQSPTIHPTGFWPMLLTTMLANPSRMPSMSSTPPSPARKSSRKIGSADFAFDPSRLRYILFSILRTNLYDHSSLAIPRSHPHSHNLRGVHPLKPSLGGSVEKRGHCYGCTICLNNTISRALLRSSPAVRPNRPFGPAVSPGRMTPQDQYTDSSGNPYRTRPFPMRNIEFRFVRSPPNNHAPVRARALVSPFSCAEFSLLCSPHGTSSLSACIPRDRFTFRMDSPLLSFSSFSLPSLYDF